MGRGGGNKRGHTDDIDTFGDALEKVEKEDEMSEHNK